MDEQAQSACSSLICAIATTKIVVVRDALKLDREVGRGVPHFSRKGTLRKRIHKRTRQDGGTRYSDCFDNCTLLSITRIYYYYYYLFAIQNTHNHEIHM